MRSLNLAAGGASQRQTIGGKHMNDCDICRAQFQSAQPNPAVLDAPIRGLGVWAGFCLAHVSRAERGVGTWLLTNTKDEGGSR